VRRVNTSAFTTEVRLLPESEILVGRPVACAQGLCHIRTWVRCSCPLL